MKENIKTEELNSIELIKLIYQEVKNTREELNEKIDTRFKYLDKKIDAKFKYLDEKINNTKNSLVAEIAEEFKNFYEMTERKINKIENKIDIEIEDRKEDVSKVKEFNRMILNDIRGRVSILEEESEKYNLN